MGFADRLKKKVEVDKANREVAGGGGDSIFIKPDKEEKNFFRALNFCDTPFFIDVYFFWLTKQPSKTVLLSPKTFGVYHSGPEYSVPLYKRMQEVYGDYKASPREVQEHWRSMLESECTVIPGFLRGEDGEPLETHEDGRPVVKFLKLSPTHWNKVMQGLIDAVQDNGIEEPFDSKKGVDISIRWASKGEYGGEWNYTVTAKKKKAMKDLDLYEKTCDELREAFTDGDEGLKHYFDYQEPGELSKTLKAYSKLNPLDVSEEEGSTGIGSKKDGRQDFEEEDDSDIPF